LWTRTTFGADLQDPHSPGAWGQEHEALDGGELVRGQPPLLGLSLPGIAGTPIPPQAGRAAPNRSGWLVAVWRGLGRLALVWVS